MDALPPALALPTAAVGLSEALPEGVSPELTVRAAVGVEVGVPPAWLLLAWGVGVALPPPVKVPAALPVPAAGVPVPLAVPLPLPLLPRDAVVEVEGEAEGEESTEGLPRAVKEGVVVGVREALAPEGEIECV